MDFIDLATKSLKKFLTINLESSVGSCPFDNQEIIESKRENIGNPMKVRFCECCKVTFKDLDQHLSSKKHQDYATNDSNYANIDAFISKNGLDIETFFEKMCKKYN